MLSSVFLFYSLCFAACQATVLDCSPGDPACTPGATLLLYQIKDDSVCSRLMGGTIQECLPTGLTGTVTHFAGTVGTNGYVDGFGTAAQFENPNGITTDVTFVYVADRANHVIRRIDPDTTEVITFAGDGTLGTNDGVGMGARFNQPIDLTSDGTYIYTASPNSYRIRRIEIATRTVTTFAGNATNMVIDGTGTSASFSGPAGITTDGTSLFVTEGLDHVIRKIDISTAVVTTFAGTVSTPGTVDGVGSSAQFNVPVGITTDGTALYVADNTGGVLRKIDMATASVSTLAGSGAMATIDGIGTAAAFNIPSRVLLDGTYNVSENQGHVIRRIDPDSVEVSTYTGMVGTTSTADGTGTAAGFNTPDGITFTGEALFVSDTFNRTIRKIE